METRTLLAKPMVTTRGFILINENEELIKKIEDIAEKTILKLRKEIEFICDFTSIRRATNELNLVFANSVSLANSISDTAPLVNNNAGTGVELIASVFNCSINSFEIGASASTMNLWLM